MTKQQLWLYLNLLENKNVSRDMKLFSIMILIHEEMLGIYGAFHICEELKLFEKSWNEIDTEISKYFLKNWPPED